MSAKTSPAKAGKSDAGKRAGDSQQDELQPETSEASASEREGTSPPGEVGSAPSSSESQTPAPENAPAPPDTSLVLAGSEDDAIHRALSAADDRQIAAELQGAAVSAMVYSYRQGGQTVTDLSYVGHMEAVRQINTRDMGRIGMAPDIFPIQWEETRIAVETGLDDDDGHPGFEMRPAIKATVFCRDEMRHGSGFYGTAVQPLEQRTNKKGKDKRFIFRPDPFAHQKAVSKAQRNAMRGFIPLESIEELKALFIGKGQVEYIAGAGRPVEEAAPRLEDDKAKALITEIEGLYPDFKKAVDGALKKLPPARFQAGLRDAWHSHDQLEMLRDWLQEQIQEAGQEKKEKDEADG